MLVPKLRKQPGKYPRAFVELYQKRIYLGRWDDPEVAERYARLIAEWNANGRLSAAPPGSSMTILELVDRFSIYAEDAYGETREFANYRPALRPLLRLYGRTSAAEFGPKALKVLRETYVAEGISRRTVNDRVGRIKRMFKWAAGEELVPASAYHALCTVVGLRRGRTAAHDPAPRRPVDDAMVRLTLPHLSDVIQAMVKVQRLVGMRSGELCRMRGRDLEMTGEVWEYHVAHHKGSWRGNQLIYPLGPRAQEILTPYLNPNLDAPLFSPADSERQRRAALSLSRQTPITAGNRPGSNRSRTPAWKPGEAYGPDTYARAIARGCEKAFPPPDGLTKEQRAKWVKEHRWTPHQLRHARATEERKRGGIEAAQLILQHQRCDVTQVYAERDREAARKLALRYG